MGYNGHVILYVGVPDVEAALQKAESLGGTRRMGPEKNPGANLVVGYFTDLEGHLSGLADRYSRPSVTQLEGLRPSVTDQVRAFSSLDAVDPICCIGLTTSNVKMSLAMPDVAPTLSLARTAFVRSSIGARISDSLSALQFSVIISFPLVGAWITGG
jgi:hypothetical protein